MVHDLLVHVGHTFILLPPSPQSWLIFFFLNLVFGIPTIGNLGLHHSYALDLIGCMHLSLKLSKSNAVKNNGFKNHYKIKIQRFQTHTCDLDILISKSIHCRTYLENLENLCPHVVTHMCVLCIQPMRVSCSSHACGLCAFGALQPCIQERLIHPRQRPEDLNHDFDTPKCGLWKERGYDSLSLQSVEIEPLKVRYDVTKLDLTIPLLSFWCIDIDLTIQFMSLKLYMTWVHQELHKKYKSWVPCKQISCPQLVHGFGQSNRDCSTPPPNWRDGLSQMSGWVSNGEGTNVYDAHWIGRTVNQDAKLSIFIIDQAIILHGLSTLRGY